MKNANNLQNHQQQYNKLFAYLLHYNPNGYQPHPIQFKKRLDDMLAI